MFKLIKILGGRINHGEPRRVNVFTPAEAIPAGTPISIVDDTVSVIEGDQELYVTHILEVETKPNQKEITVTDVLPGMVFSAPFSGSITDYAIGSEYIIEGGKLSSELVSLRGAGAVVYDIPEREDAKELLVTFRVN